MAGGSVTFALDDGETLSLADEDLRPIYDALWGLAPESGAVSTAVLLKDAWRLSPFARKPIALTTPQGAVLRKAISLLHA
jgi:hypothetical protein